MDERDELAALYFGLGFKQKEIIFSLARRHGIILSIRTLKRVLKRRNLYRRKHMTDILEVAVFIEGELAECGKLHGYRWMHQKCIMNGLVVTQETVRLLTHILDPDGIAIRRARRLRRRRYASRGPNWVWHLDGYDKLKPYGIALHGCIDGFSRYVLWLHAHHTNNNPSLIAGYFMKAVQERGGCPAIVRADRGTENGHVEVMQKSMRAEHTDTAAGDHSFLYGKSTANQRIESWWATCRKQCSQHWINVFSELKDDGKFSGDFLDKNLIRFSFMEVVQVSVIHYFFSRPDPCSMPYQYHCLQKMPSLRVMYIDYYREAKKWQSPSINLRYAGQRVEIISKFEIATVIL